MMRTLWYWLATCLVAVIILSGCGKENVEDDSMHKKENKQKQVTDLSFQSITADESPKRVNKWLEKNRSKQENKVFNVNGKTYVVVQLGQKPTGGFAVTIGKIQYGTSADSSNDLVTVHYKVKKPEKGSINTQALTYPNAIVVLDGEYHVPFQFTSRAKSTKLTETEPGSAAPKKKEDAKKKKDKDKKQTDLVHPQTLTPDGKTKEIES